MPPTRMGLSRDENGFVLVFFAVCIPAMLGLVGLAIDGARLMTLDTQLASLADSAALAAASRLDRSPSAIRNARSAASALSDNQLAAERGSDSLRVTFRFAANLSDLRTNPRFSLPESASAAATYVEALTAETSLTTSFLQLVGAQNVPLRRRAIAESQYYACDVTPAALCQPDPDAFISKAKPGRQYLLRFDGSKNAGSIALLDQPGTESGRQTLRNFASDGPQLCYAEDIKLRTNLTPIEFDEAVGIRFDLYQGRSGPVAPDLAVYPPAPNVVKGRKFDTCRSSPEGGSTNPPIGLPRDSAYREFPQGGLWDQGIGDWKTAPPRGGLGALPNALDEYIAWNHANKSPEFQDRLRNAKTRYAIYLTELGLTVGTEAKPVDTRSLGQSAETMPSGGPPGNPQTESPVPVCYSGGRPAVEARRRILYLAIADCSDFSASATAANLSRRVGKFFLTEPSEAGATLVEFVAMVTPTEDDGKLRHVVQLVTTD